MLKIDNYDISLTRGDTATIEFSAKTESGETYVAQNGDKLTFSVAKKYGGDKLISITNSYVSAETFWNIVIPSSATKEMKFGEYYWDLQLETTNGTYTIIGKTDEYEPTFTVWEEVS